MLTSAAERVRRVLRWLRIEDAHDGNLSLTNAAAIVAIWKFAWLKTFTLPELAAFFLSLLAYAVKSHRRARSVTAAHEEKVTALAGVVDGIKAKLVKGEVAQALGKIPGR